MKEKIADRLARKLQEAYLVSPTGLDSITQEWAEELISLIREEIKPQLVEIEELTSAIEGDWTDPRYECEKISEKIEAILKALES